MSISAASLPESKKALVLQRPNIRTRGVLRELLETALFVLAIYTLIEMSAPRFLVEGPSMQPTFYDEQRLIISRLSYLFNEPRRGDIVVFNAPGSFPQEPPLIKRTIGLPGDVVELRNAQFYVNGVLLEEPYTNGPCNPLKCPNARWELGDGEYFLVGDNRNHSRDSREFDAVPHSAIIGQALIRYWPPEGWGIIERVGYPYLGQP